MRTENTSKWYETRRNELLALLKEASALDVPEKYADELRQTTRKCQEDAFEIALVGEFQGGKSTTFNALCDGRDISPRGLGGGGIKTSAAVISAQNIAGDETKDGLAEWAEVSFKTPGAIALGLSTILRRPLMDSEAFRKFNAKLSDSEFAEALATDDGFTSLVDIDDAKCRAALKSATDALWGKWKENRASLSDDELDELRIATLQLRFFGSSKYRTMAAQTVLPIDKFQKLIAFPKDWMIRWMNGPDSEFSLDEVAFVFVQSVLVRIHAENLRRLGCRITDCPGLFANAYDTSVARRTILNADAVWYLINGEKQIGQKDLEIVRAIAAMGMLGKIEATCNLKGPHEQKMAEIIPATKAALANAGHAVEVFPYNARLAFLAMQGDLLLNRESLFSSLDKANMRIDAKVKDGDPSPASMWAKMVRRVGSSAELDDVENVDDLDAESVTIVRRESMLDGILTRLEDEIIPQKAQSILVNRGSDRASKALVAYEGVLKATEDAAEAEESKWREEVAKAKAALDDFVDCANSVIDRSALRTERDDFAAAMAREVAEMAFSDRLANELANRIGIAVRERYKKFYLRKSTLKQDLMAEIAPIMSESVKNAMSDALGKWQKSRKSPIRKTLHSEMALLAASIREKWASASLDVAALSEFSVPAIDEEFIADCSEESFDGIFTEKDIGSIRMEGVTDKVLQVFLVALLGGICIAVAVSLVGMFTGAVAIPVALIARGGVLLFHSIGDWLKSDAEKAAEKAAAEIAAAKAEQEAKEAEEKEAQEKLGRIAASIRPKIEAAFADHEFREKVEKPLALGFRDSLDGMVGKVRDSLETLKSDFEKERVAEPEKMFSKSVSDRKAIAKQNKTIRTKTIEPLRKRIDAFKDAVVADLSASA